METNTQLLSTIKEFQRNEISEYFLYLKLAKAIKSEENKKILEQIAHDEKAHADFWKRYTNVEVKPNKLRIFFYYWVARILGLTFGIKLMEKGEIGAQEKYAEVINQIPEAERIMNDEESHEQKLIAMINEEKLDYVGSIVLGLNDALVELTGALAGLTFALQNTKLIAIAGLITGIAASFSMAASQYLSQKAEENENALKSSIYTGFAYIATVGLLILPYLLLDSYMTCLFMTLTIAILIILFFNYYISIAKDLPFKKRFLEMAVISLSVSAITFGIGVLVKKFIGVDV
jgi:VIT1/CCC1 family predicted Fe2+/Mn2+ transporter